MPYIKPEIRTGIQEKGNPMWGTCLDCICRRPFEACRLSEIIAYLVFIYCENQLKEFYWPLPLLSRSLFKVSLSRSLFKDGDPELDFDTIVAVGNIKKILGKEIGNFNYVITYILHKLLEEQGGVSYSKINYIVGVLEGIEDRFCEAFQCCKNQTPVNVSVIFDNVRGLIRCIQLEFYRMIASPYEDKKIIENGPVSDLDKLPKS